jgi:hypothetical protein
MIKSGNLRSFLDGIALKSHQCDQSSLLAGVEQTRFKNHSIWSLALASPVAGHSNLS